MSKNTGTSELINYFDLGVNGDVGIAGSLDINTIANATTDTDTFLVSDTGIIKYRTGAQLLSDIGAAPAVAGGYVPYTGATTNVDLGVYNLTTSAIIANGSGSNSGIVHLESNAIHSLVNGYGSIASGTTNQFNLYQTTGAGVFRGAILSLNSITEFATRTFTLPDADGTIALTSNIPANAVGGTGTTNYLPKFTGSTTIGNSNLINDASGNLGLGINPTNVSNYIRLQISGTTGGIFDLLSGSTRHFTIYNDSSSSIIGTVTNTPLIFQTNDGTKMTLTSGGNLLVGTTTDAGFRMAINGPDGTSYLKFTSTAAATGGRIGYNGNEMRIDQQENANLIFRTNGSTQMTITSSGNVGIGTASPESLSNNTTLQIDGTNHSFVRTGNSNYGGYFATIPTAEVLCISNVRNPVTGTYNNTGKAASGINLFSQSSNGYITFLTTGTNNSAPTERMRITSSGDVNFSGGAVRADGGYFSVRTSGGSAVSGYLLREATWLGTGTSTNLALAAENAGGELVFFTGGQTTTRMKITSGGNVLIGTQTDSGTRLNVNGTTFTQVFTQSVPLHGVKVLSYGPTSSATIDLPTEFPLMLLTAGNVWGVFGKYCGFDAGGVEVREFVIARNSGGGWAAANYGPQSQTNASLQSVTGSGNTITINVDAGCYFIVELTVFVR